MTRSEMLEICQSCLEGYGEELTGDDYRLIRAVESRVIASCAQVCDAVAEQVTYQRSSQDAADKCAAAIRAPLTSGPNDG